MTTELPKKIHINLAAENINAGTVHLSRVPFGRSYRYFLKLKGQNVRISKDVYRGIKQIVRDKS